MSRPSPVTRRFIWKGGADGGVFKFYNGDEDELVKNPFTFVVLDERSGITGWNDAIGGRLWSNHIIDQSSEVLTVRCGKKTVCKGLYADIKDSIRDNGGKYANYLYVAYKNEDGEYSIGTLELSGSALGSWIEFSKDKPVTEGSVTCTDFEQRKKGVVTFRVPVLESSGITPEADQICTDLDVTLQDWFDSAGNRSETNDDEVENEVSEKTSDELLF
jgi:hypothetical protein